jgi:hypothetical protein
MKKLLTLFFFMSFLMGTSFAQLVNWPESFEGTTFPPTGWAVINLGDANTWVRTTSYPAQTGTASAYIVFSAAAHNDYLIAPKLAPVAGNSSVSFWARNYSTSYVEQFDVKLSTTGFAGNQCCTGNHLHPVHL